MSEPKPSLELIKAGTPVTVIDAYGGSWGGIVSTKGPFGFTLNVSQSKPEPPAVGVPAVVRAWLEKHLRDVLGEPPVPEPRLATIRSFVADDRPLVPVSAHESVRIDPVLAEQRKDLYRMLDHYERFLDFLLREKDDRTEKLEQWYKEVYDRAYEEGRQTGYSQGVHAEALRREVEGSDELRESRRRREDIDRRQEETMETALRDGDILSTPPPESVRRTYNIAANALGMNLTATAAGKFSFRLPQPGDIIEVELRDGNAAVRATVVDSRYDPETSTIITNVRRIDTTETITCISHLTVNGVPIDVNVQFEQPAPYVLPSARAARDLNPT